MKKRTEEQRSAWIPNEAYNRMLPAVTVNLLVRDIDVAVQFYRDVLGATTRYAGPDFAALRVDSLEFMLHADHTYDGHAWHRSLQAGDQRGLGAELRLLGVDPDALEARATAGAKSSSRTPTVTSGR